MSTFTEHSTTSNWKLGKYSASKAARNNYFTDTDVPNTIELNLFQITVARKPVNANLGLKFNQGSCFSYSKEFSQQITSDYLKTTKVRMQRKRDLQQSASFGYETGVKIDANPGLA